MPRRSSTPKTARNPGRKSNPKAAKAEFPYRDKDSKALEDGAQVARARYHREVDRSARSILDEVKDVTRPSEREESLRQAIDEEAERGVTYTRQALEIVELSDSWLAMDDAVEEGIASWNGLEGVTDAITKMAYFAYHKDLTDQIEALKDEYFSGEDEDEDE